jgi:hypothetical protein
MATYKQVQAYVKSKSGWTPETCWIADVKASLGIAMRKAWNRRGEDRVKPCPSEKRYAIEEALRHFGMIK